MPRRWPALTLAFAVTFGVGLIASAGTAQADVQLLTAVTEYDERADTVAWWWSTPDQPAWSAADTALHGLLDELEVTWIDPGALASPPSVSRVVYGTPDLSANNAINLASLFNAGQVISGTVRYRSAGEVALFGEVGIAVELDLHIHATNSAIELLPLEVTEIAFAETEDEALDIARKAAFDRVRSLLRHSRTFDDVQVGVSSDEPLLVISGLRRGGPLVQIKRRLKERDDIDDAVERWAAEGVIAVELNPGVLDEPDLVYAAIDEMLRHPFDTFLVQEVRREPDRVEVIVLERPRGSAESDAQ